MHPTVALDSRYRVRVLGIFIYSTFNAEECLWEISLPLGTNIQTRDITRGMYPIHEMIGIVVPCCHLDGIGIGLGGKGPKKRQTRRTEVGLKLKCRTMKDIARCGEK
jgi:hypothetical protein